MFHVCGILRIAPVHPLCTAEATPGGMLCLLKLPLGMHSFALSPVPFWLKLVKQVRLGVWSQTVWQYQPDSINP